MDIFVHIGELLYDHDCVIIPGFGGFVCSYQPATINTERRLVYPPGKAVSFNRFLQSNDGLLVNQIAAKRAISFYDASESVNAWTSFSNTLLSRNEEIVLHNIGRFFNDAEGNLQFEPDAVANYLKSSYGLRPLPAAPVMRAREIKGRKGRRLEEGFNRRVALRIAASVLILACIGLFTEMMRMDVHIKGLELNQASVAGFVNRLFHTDEKRMEPIPIQVQPASGNSIDSSAVSVVLEPLTAQAEVKEETVAATPTIHEAPTTTAAVVNTNNTGTAYYIIVGAFKEEQNAENVRAKLLGKFSANNILFEKHGSLTKVGYFAGNSFGIAREQLISAQAVDSNCWMLKK